VSCVPSEQDVRPWITAAPTGDDARGSGATECVDNEEISMDAETPDWDDLRQAQIVFCSMVDCRARLDCVSASDDSFGWPFTIMVDVPDTVEWSTVAAATLGRWTREARALELQLNVDRSPQRVRISDGLNVMRLDLVDVCTKS
jgi:hypothetical protein